MMCIYTITNLVTGKIYVGSAMDYASRKRVHRHHLNHGTHHCPYLQASWAKHGEQSFVFDVVEIVDDAFWLLAREQAWINREQSFDRNFGYNGRPTAESNQGKPVSEKTRELLRAHNLGKKASPEKLAKMRGREVSQETRDKRSESLKTAYAEGRHSGGFASFKGKPKSEAWKAKVRGPRDLSPETRKLMSDAAKAREAKKKLERDGGGRA